MTARKDPQGRFVTLIQRDPQRQAAGARRQARAREILMQPKGAVHLHVVHGGFVVIVRDVLSGLGKRSALELAVIRAAHVHHRADELREERRQTAEQR